MRTPIAAIVVAEAVVRRPEAIAEARARRPERRMFPRFRLRRRPPLPDDAAALRLRTPATV